MIALLWNYLSWWLCSIDSYIKATFSNDLRCSRLTEHKAEHNNCRMRGTEPDLQGFGHDCKCLKTSEGGENGSFAKPLYWLIPVPRVRIPPSPPYH